MKRKKIVSIGHSHLSAYRRAYDANTEVFNSLNIDVHFAQVSHKTFAPAWITDDNGIRHLTDDFKQRLSFIVKREAPDLIHLCLMGNEYNAIAMVKHPTPYDFYEPNGQAKPLPEAIIIPYEVIKSQLRKRALNGALLFANFINEITPCPAILVPPPPPIYDESHIASYPSSFSKRVEKYGLMPPEFRKKMHTLYCKILSEAVDSTNVEFLEISSRICPEGFLPPKYRQQDPTHGNANYGLAAFSELIHHSFKLRINV